jgi:GPI mannosyltransferase 4
MVLAFLLVLGCFNRITFPAYVLVPGLQLFPHFARKPLSLISTLLFGILFTFIAIVFDTSFYRPNFTTYLEVIHNPVITPLNNFLYNYSPENLSAHGLHPFYQHAINNLPLLLGPAIILLLVFWRRSFRLYSAISAVLVLSLFPHQEARFLIPAVPLILSSVRLPADTPRFGRAWVVSWVLFNAIMGAVMGTFHQGGVVPMQMHVARATDVSQVTWWRTYPPPTWLLGGRIDDVKTSILMGAPKETVVAELINSVSCGKKGTGVVLVAPASATVLDEYSVPEEVKSGLVLRERFRISRHIGLDDLDFAEDGIWGTLKRVWGRRGLVMWDVEKIC